MTAKSAAPNGPGLPPRWTRGAKEAVGTAYSTASRVWYTVAAGILTEVYLPDDRHAADSRSAVPDHRRRDILPRRTAQHHVRRIDCVDEASLGFEIVNVADSGAIRIRKTLIGASASGLRADADAGRSGTRRVEPLQLYVLCAPHLEIGGWHNNAEVVDTKAGRIIVAFKGGDVDGARSDGAVLTRCSCGYVAVNDGWTDLHDNRTLDWQYDAAYDGNIAVTAQIDLSRGADFTLGLAFGDTRHRAITNAVPVAGARRSTPACSDFATNGAEPPGASRWRPARRIGGLRCSTSAA